MNPHVYERTIWRAAAGWSGVFGALAVLFSAGLRGWPGFWGATIGAAVVVIFLAIHLLVSALTKSMDPISTMAMAMFAYFAKVLALAGFLIAFRGVDFIDRAAFGATAICVTVAWLAAEIRVFTKARFVLAEGYHPGASKEGQGDGERG